MADGTVIPGRRQPIDFPNSGLTAGTPGLDDVKKGNATPAWQGEQYGRSEASRGTAGFEGSFTVARDFDRQNAGTTESLSPGNQHKNALGSERN